MFRKSKSYLRLKGGYTGSSLVSLVEPRHVCLQDVCRALWERSRVAVAMEWKELRREAIAEDGEALKVGVDGGRVLHTLSLLRTVEP